MAWMAQGKERQQVAEHAELLAVAGAAAAALVAEMVKESWSAMRTAAARLFRHGGEAEEQRQLQRLDADQAQVATADAAELRDRWQRRFITLIEDFPEAMGDLTALARRRQDGESGGNSQNVMGNSGSVIQIAGDSHGSINTGAK